MPEGRTQGLRPFVVTIPPVDSNTRTPSPAPPPPQIHTEVISRSLFECEDWFLCQFCLWRRPPGPPGISMRAVYAFAEASRGRAPPGSTLAPLPPLRNIPVSALPSLLRRLDVRTTFPVAFIFQQFQKSVLRCNAQRKKRTYPFPFLYLYLRTRKTLLRGPYLGPINPLFHWSELDLLFLLNPVTGKRNGISLMGLDRSGFTQK